MYSLATDDFIVVTRVDNSTNIREHRQSVVPFIEECIPGNTIKLFQEDLQIPVLCPSPSCDLVRRPSSVPRAPSSTWPSVSVHPHHQSPQHCSLFYDAGPAQ